MLTYLEQTEKDEKHKEHLLLPARPLPNFELMSSYFPTKKYKKYKRIQGDTENPCWISPAAHGHISASSSPRPTH